MKKMKKSTQKRVWIITHLIYLVILPFWLFARTHVRYDFCLPGSENLFWLICLFYLSWPILLASSLHLLVVGYFIRGIKDV
jgi:hypothetical protein